ncbi:MAG: sulfatase-like hydrolase/transferase [Myxococcales bacterium]|nr:sulfatase-like hydrolase/transferase [Myxococcales bacterium]
MTEPNQETAPSATARPLTRGLGLVAGVASFGVAGFADGVISLARMSPGSLAPHLSVLVLLHCTAVLLTFGIGLGLFEELCLSSLRRVPFLARFARWSVQGPRRWYARDPEAAGSLLAVSLGAGVAFGPMYPIAYSVIRSFHSKPLAALAIFLAQLGLTLLGAAVGVVALTPLRALGRRLGPLGSPGMVITAVGLGVIAQSVRFFYINWQAFHALEYGAAALGAALLVGNVVALLALGARVTRAGAALDRRTPLFAMGVAVVAFLLSAMTFGARQTVAATISNRSVLTQRVARTLQVTLDFDRDGFSPVFNGGDCNDRDPSINPRAHDIPGNGRDENCSGRDAVVEQQESDGHLATLPPALANARPSIVFLSIDAMRPDHMGCYGYRRATTPNIDRFAQEAARFTSVYCAAPRSLRSFGSIFTGLYASSVAWGDDVQFPPLELSNTTLAEQLLAAGYHTASFNGTSYFSHTANFFQGFQTVREEYGFKQDAQTTANAIVDFLRLRDSDPQPFFLWSHLMEPHDPYRDLNNPRDFGSRAIDLYDEEIAHADAAFGTVLTALHDMASRRPLYVFVFADHGEGFGEHGVFHHSFDLHEEALRVPLLVRGPEVRAGVRNRLSSLMDLNPTVLNLAGLRPERPIAGWSLVPALFDPAPGGLTPPGWRQHLYAEVTPDGVFSAESKALIAPPFKLLYDIRHNVWELFDLSRDPGERRNLFDDRPDIVGPMRERLLTWTEHSALQSNRSTELIARSRLRSVPRTIQHPMRVRFGDIMEFLGYDLPLDSVRINETFRAVLYYRVLRRTRVPAMPTVSFDPVDGQPIWGMFIARHHPIYGRYPTTEWSPGEILRDEVTLRIDPEMRPVRLRSFFSLEIESTNERIAPQNVPSGDNRIELSPIEILPAQ